MSHAVRGLRRCLLAAGLISSLTAVAPAAAGANTLPDASVSSKVMVIPSLGGFPDGASRMSVSFSDSTATATASGTSVGLGPGHVFHVDTCIKAHLINSSYNN